MYKCHVKAQWQIWQQSARATYQLLSLPAQQDRATQKASLLKKNVSEFSGEQKSAEVAVRRNMTRQKKQEDWAGGGKRKQERVINHHNNGDLQCLTRTGPKR